VSAAAGRSATQQTGPPEGPHEYVQLVKRARKAHPPRQQRRQPRSQGRPARPSRFAISPRQRHAVAASWCPSLRCRSRTVSPQPQVRRQEGIL
jgi:hypothetical protein